MFDPPSALSLRSSTESEGCKLVGYDSAAAAEEEIIDAEGALRGSCEEGVGNVLATAAEREEG